MPFAFSYLVISRIVFLQMVYSPVHKKRILHGIHIKKKTIAWGFSTLVLVALIFLQCAFKIIPGHKELKATLTAILSEVAPGQGKAQKQPIAFEAVIYVLGGSQQSLEEKFKTVAGLCNKDSCRKILLLSQPGITQFDPSLGRNLQNDEWAIKQLTGLGVKQEALEPVSFKKGLFGTLTEAEGLSDIAVQRGYKRIILVTSQCHTKRTWITFSRVFENRSIELSIYAASENEPVALRSLLYEYLKLVLYQKVILPHYTEQNRLRREVS